MTPLERAARVLARRSCPPGGEAQFPYVSTDEWEEKHWRDHVDPARAVLTAIREPSEGMIEHARWRSAETLSHEVAVSMNWREMIDAALAESI